MFLTLCFRSHSTEFHHKNDNLETFGFGHTAVHVPDLPSSPCSQVDMTNGDAHILRLGSVEDAFLPDSMDHMIVEFRRDLPRSLWTVHSYHPPVLGTKVTGSTLHASTLTWKTSTITTSGLPQVRVVHRLLHILTAKLLSVRLCLLPPGNNTIYGNEEIWPPPHTHH